MIKEHPMRKVFFVLSLVGCLFSLNSAYAQKWGKVEPEELAMTSIPEDPEANAVVLFDIGEMSITNNFNLHVKRHIRIKILTEEGKDLADEKIKYWHEAKLKKLEAQTILPGGKKVKLDKDQIFEEKDGKWKQKVFTFPAVEVGTIIEYRYEFISEYLRYLEPWRFQNDEFTKLSRLTMELPYGFKYRAFFAGLHDQSIDPVKEKINTGPRRNDVTFKYTWTFTDLPALRPEPRMGNIEDYRTALYFQLSSYATAYSNIQFINSWDDLAAEIMDSYRHILNEDKGLVKLEQDLVPDTVRGVDRAESLYVYVKDDINSSSQRKLFGLTPPHQVVEDKEGSNIEKNILLTNLLRHAGFEAHPVLISTRSNGKFRERWAQLTQFNHVITLLRIGNRSYSLDTSDSYCPFALLPTKDLNGKGFMVTEEGGEIVEIEGPKKVSKRGVTTKAVLDEEGAVHCRTVFCYEGYQAVRERKIYDEKGEEDYIDGKIKDRFGDVELDTFEVRYKDDLIRPFEVVLDFTLPDYVQETGDMIYITPPLWNHIESNPFEDEERRFPVEYPYEYTSTDEIELSIPDGYRILEKPRAKSVRRPGLMYSTNCMEVGEAIMYTRRYKRNKVVFEPAEYQQVRSFFSEVIGCDQASLVLGR